MITEKTEFYFVRLFYSTIKQNLAVLNDVLNEINKQKEEHQEFYGFTEVQHNPYFSQLKFMEEKIKNQIRRCKNALKKFEEGD